MPKGKHQRFRVGSKLFYLPESEAPTRCSIDVEIDIEDLAEQFASKAAGSKSKRATRCHGAVRVVLRPEK